MSATFGTTLRLLRLESGMSLRDLAGRLGVSSVYLSRVENGIDGTPTPGRIQALARELGVPPLVLLELGQRISPLVADYVEARPEAGDLFVDLVHRNLNSAELKELRSFVERKFPRPLQAPVRVPLLSDLVGLERIVVGLSCEGIGDLLDIAAGRLALGAPHVSAAGLAAALRAREAECSGALGSEISVHSIVFNVPSPRAALVTLRAPLMKPSPDRLPIRLGIVFAIPGDDGLRVARFAHVARLGRRGLAEELCDCGSAEEVRGRLRHIESFN